MSGLIVKCPTCREKFDLELDDKGFMWGRSFSYDLHRRGSFPRLRAFFRLLCFWSRR